MPKRIKKRATKSPAVQEDKVKGIFDGLRSMVKERRKHIITVGSLVGAIIVLYILLAFYNNSVRQKAYALELEAYEYYYGADINSPLTEEKRWRKALELFGESVKVRSTPSALFYLGNCYYKLGEYDNAVKEFRKFVKEFSENEEIIPIVYQKLASSLMKIGQRDEAFEMLWKLADLSGGIFRDTALVLEARYYNELGDPMKELEKYRELVTLFPQSSWVPEAMARIEKEESAKSGALEEKVRADKEEASTPSTGE